MSTQCGQAKIKIPTQPASVLTLTRKRKGGPAALIFDAAGNLYGTTQSGGTYSGGTVFDLSPQAGGGWTEKVLHNLNLNRKEGGIWTAA